VATVTTVRLSLDEIHALVRRVLARNGLSDLQAAPVADIVTQAEGDECRSHGLYRIPGYVTSLRSGRVRANALPRVEHLAAGAIRVDGDGGFAPAASQAGRPALVAAARRNGIAALALTRCHHFSTLWQDAEPLAEAGLVVWCFVIGQQSVAPHGGTRRLMGTNPMGFAWPRRGAPPFVFDFATSVTARGEVELKRLAGEELPEGWAIDTEGRPTTDPARALAGALLPFGGYKGSALSMMVELIAGPLIGELTSGQVADLAISDGGPPPGGELFMAIDPAVFGPDAAGLGERLFKDALGQPGVRLPSARRHAARARTQQEGVQVRISLLDQIKAFCDG
jgi:delta1-piperideine-2-carboxylate reductase